MGLTMPAAKPAPQPTAEAEPGTMPLSQPTAPIRVVGRGPDNALVNPPDAHVVHARATGRIAPLPAMDQPAPQRRAA
jgi:hypothetical protein